MSRRLKMRKPQWAEVQRLQGMLEASDHPGIRRRAEAVLFYGAGSNATEIAQALNVHPNTIYADLQAFGEHGVAGVEAWGTVGLPPELTEQQKVRIRQLASQSPAEVGLPWGRWSLAKLRDYLIEHQVLNGISREHVRRVLKRGRCASAGSRKSLSAPTRVADRSWPVFAEFGGICLLAACWCSSM